ncbi:uncharacterized protein LOC130672739 [Microplitis mediator]|uniref:uncharacterized protein LOC130672739 n=1 Tax=Microplitis mediator TaxID=375433 RepID=UPI002552FD03|nr:uncharacterized protein LOC130672739 [Microplitis mediator]
MNYFHLSSFEIRALIIIIEVNVLLVTSELVPIQKGDPYEWRNIGENANFDRFNSIYAVTVKEELLRSDGYCSGKCDGLESWRQSVIPLSLSYPNSCKGTIHYCWFQKETDRRKAASDKVSKFYRDYAGPYAAYLFEKHGADIRAAEVNRDHTGNDCTCLCERTRNDEVDLRGELVDSICYDPISVDHGYVATGVRFKRHSNIIYLELQQGILSAGRIDRNSLKWKSSDQCSSSKKVVYNWSSSYTGLEIILEDMKLPENAVVTGITFGQSLRGRYVNDDGDFNDNVDQIVKGSQCPGSVSSLSSRCGVFLLPTSLVGKNNELSKSCENKISFCGSDEGSGYMQHVVPYVDLQEIVTDQSSPQPIRGIGWYYRSHPGYGGFLALKIFK